MLVSAIVAVAKNNVIGRDNDIPWYLPADLQYFKRTTLHHHIIMGRKSFQSIGRPLPKRTNIVVTRDPFFIASNLIVTHSIEEALEIAHKNDEEEAFIIGGGQIYQQTQQYWDKVYLTQVEVEVAGDVYFPELQPETWQLVSSETHEPDEKNEYAYTFKIFERIST